jgi:hypothetical protein
MGDTLTHLARVEQVVDLVHERAGSSWYTRVASYPKLRLSGAAPPEVFAAAGLHAEEAGGTQA